MPSTRRSRGSGRHVFAHVALLFAACVAVMLFSLTVLGGDRVQASPPDPPHGDGVHPGGGNDHLDKDRKSTRLNSSHVEISYAVFCLKKKNRPTANRFLDLKNQAHSKPQK